MESYSDQGVERSFLIDGLRVASVIKRLDILTDQQNWLSLKPVSDGRFAHVGVSTKKFGEMNQHNKLHGRGIYIDSSGNISIAFWNDGKFATSASIGMVGLMWVGLGRIPTKMLS